MSENTQKHTLNVGQLEVVSASQIAVSDEVLNRLETQIAEIRAKAAGEKPKWRLWDVVRAADGQVYVRTEADMWVHHDASYVIEDGSYAIATGTYLGNVMDWVNGGDVVVGMSGAYAMALCEHFRGASAWAQLTGNVRDTLARYEKGRP